MLGRRQFLPLLSALGANVIVTSSTAKETRFELKLAHSTPAGHPLHLRLSEASRRIDADSNGRVELALFPHDQLGSQADALSQVRSGTLDFVAISGLVLSRLVPASAIGAMAFAFRDLRRVWQAMDGELGELIRDEIAKTGTVFAMPSVFDNGFRQLTTSPRAIHSLADLSGLKIRVPTSALSVSLFKALGTTPTVTNTSEIYTSLQTGLVDGQENPLALIWDFGLYEVQRHCALTNHMWDGLWLVGNRARFDLLPAALRALVTFHLNAAALAEREDLVALNRELRQRLVGKGVQFTEPLSQPFRDRLRAVRFYDEWRARLPPAAWSRLESVVGPL